MKILLIILLLLNFGVSNSQNFIDGIINCATHWANEKLRFSVEKDILENNFKLEKSETIIEVYNKNVDKLERLTLEEFYKSEFPATQLWLNYKILDEGLILTELSFPFNLNCSTPWNLKDTEEILEPYLKVLQNKTKIDLEKALEIGTKNGLNEICYWDIDYEKRKLIWTIKDKKDNVIKINAKNGKVSEKYVEIRID
jgi:hypothetical protein